MILHPIITTKFIVYKSIFTYDLLFRRVIAIAIIPGFYSFQLAGNDWMIVFFFRKQRCSRYIAAPRISFSFFARD